MRRIALLVIAACSSSGNSNMTSDGAPGGGSSDAPGGVGEPADLTGITLYHNQVRAAVDTTGVAGGPIAAMQWDPALATLAANWVAQCIDTDGNGLVDHSSTAYRTNAAGYSYVGENIFASSGTATAQATVDAWAAEKQYYTYATNSCATDEVCGHYTQVVWRASLHVGCALHDCTALQYPSTVVCNYGPGGNYNGESPY